MAQIAVLTEWHIGTSPRRSTSGPKL